MQTIKVVKEYAKIHALPFIFEHHITRLFFCQGK